MHALCEGLGIKHDKLPDDIYELHNRIKPIHLRLHALYWQPLQISKNLLPRRVKERDLWMPIQIQIPPKHLVCKPPKETSTDPTPLPTGSFRSS
ncbi:hypothetical protein CDAR_29571 [Caerostris darwini]|uniref:Uncharacterized protein n=1 Tax=Caerostris darwini TaxID=1538125 RepID=A0AAV4VBK4_9ARAC|nr:hypothetical protein CDAR_29571 [Caerostris darwini]